MDSGHAFRLELMEDWYRDLVGSDECEQQLLGEYAPHAEHLASLRGSVLDVGGGAGLAARFLHPSVSYVVVDPSGIWDSPEWLELGARFRGSGPEPTFIKRGGEHLPFDDGSFDAILSMWSLNHVSSPARCVSEMARVLRAGGSARLVLEDVEPHWPELLVDGARRAAARLKRQQFSAKIKQRFVPAVWMKLRRRWPIQEDHIRISQRQLSDWMRGRFDLQRKQWLDGWLTLDLTRR